MERLFVFWIGSSKTEINFDTWHEIIESTLGHQLLVYKKCGDENPGILPQNVPCAKWTVYNSWEGNDSHLNFTNFKERLLVKFGNAVHHINWSTDNFRFFQNHAIDVVVFSNEPEEEELTEFVKKFDQSNYIEIVKVDTTKINSKLYWRGSLRVSDPQNLSQHGLLKSVELSYDSDELDLLTAKVRNTISYSSCPTGSQAFVFSRMLELVQVFNYHSIPLVFCTPISLNLTVNQEEFWKRLNENVTFLFRLGYTCEDSSNSDSDMKYISFISRFNSNELKLHVLKNLADIVNMSSVFIRSPVNPIRHLCGKISHSVVVDLNVNLNQLEKHIRNLQFVAINKWIEEHGTINETIMNQILNEVVATVMKSHKPVERKIVPMRNACSDMDLLKFRLNSKYSQPESGNNELLRSITGTSITVDVNQICRLLHKKGNISPKKNKPGHRPLIKTSLKPNTDIEAVKVASWRESLQFKYHGIQYNLNEDCEKHEMQLVKFKEKFVPLETSTWCNPWSIHQSVTYQLTNKALNEGMRTPRKSNISSNMQLRKSPRLLANNQPRTRRTPVKNSSLPDRKPVPEFKQKLKGVIIRVLSDQGMDTKNPLFRTCANKLSVICFELLKDCKDKCTTRQMLNVAKSHVKQVIQFVKDK